MDEVFNDGGCGILRRLNQGGWYGLLRGSLQEIFNELFISSPLFVKRLVLPLQALEGCTGCLWGECAVVWHWNGSVSQSLGWRWCWWPQGRPLWATGGRPAHEAGCEGSPARCLSCAAAAEDGRLRSTMKHLKMLAVKLLFSEISQGNFSLLAFSYWKY